MTDSSSPSSSDSQPPPRRHTSNPALNGSTLGRPVKRRASRACQCCRTRKVRCNVVEHGAPCTNCRLDEVECIVTESKRRKKLWAQDGNPVKSPRTSNPSPRASIKVEHFANSHVGDVASQASPDCDTLVSPSQASFSSLSDRDHDHHVPHLLYQTQCRRLSQEEINYQAPVAFTKDRRYPLFCGNNLSSSTINGLLKSNAVRPGLQRAVLPNYIKILPARINSVDEDYLWRKGALTVPPIQLRNELLRNYLDYVHPFMPLLDFHQFITLMEGGDGATGRISLLLFQAVMFAGSTYVDMRHLNNAGYTTRKTAQKALFQKVKLLYDFEYEADRIALVQSLLLMTCWYESPDDQKDTWHWMGVAISLAFSIGLHRDPQQSTMDPARKQLWKRIWWSCFTRERLVALGMRRPTRIREEDYNMPMLTLDDFNFDSLPETLTSVSSGCVVARSVESQRQLAVLCIEHAKLSICISQILSSQYSVRVNNQGYTTMEGNTATTMILLPKRTDSNSNDIETCDLKLIEWLKGLPKGAMYATPTSRDLNQRRPLVMHRALLHMIYHTAISALHRPQILPCAPAMWHARNQTSPPEILSRQKLHTAATEITRIAQDLQDVDLVQCLPSTGVTVLLPAIVIHLLNLKAPDENVRDTSLQGFCRCMLVMQRLSENHAAADYATEFLEAAIRKADIQLPTSTEGAGSLCRVPDLATLLELGKWRTNGVVPDEQHQLTPPPEHASSPAVGPALDRYDFLGRGARTDVDLAHKLTSFLAYTPPSSDRHESDTRSQTRSEPAYDNPDVLPGTFCRDSELDCEFDALVDLDGAAEQGSFFGDYDDAGEEDMGVPESTDDGFHTSMDWTAGGVTVA